jgi:hypothetical protein
MNEVDFIQQILVLSEKSKQLQGRLSDVVLRNDARLRFGNQNSITSFNSHSNSESSIQISQLKRRIEELEGQNRTFKQLLSSDPTLSTTVFPPPGGEPVTEGVGSKTGRRDSFKAFVKEDSEEAWEKKMHPSDADGSASPLELTNKVTRLERSLEENRILISKLRSKNKALEEEVVELRNISTIEDPTRLNSGMALLMEEILKLRQRLGDEDPHGKSRRKSLKELRKGGAKEIRKSISKNNVSSSYESTQSSLVDKQRTEELENEVEVLVLRVKELQEQNESLSRSSV